MVSDEFVREGEHVASSGELAALLGVHVHTVTRWAREGRIPSFRTVGDAGRLGDYRYDLREVTGSFDVNAVKWQRAGRAFRRAVERLRAEASSARRQGERVDDGVGA